MTYLVVPASVVRGMKAQVAAALDVDPEDLTGPSRQMNINVARWTAMRALRDRGASLPQIGRVFDRHHSTVIHALREFDKLAVEEPVYARIALEASRFGKMPKNAWALVRQMRA